MEEMRNRKNEEIRIDLKRLAKALRNHTWLIGIAAVVCAGLVLLYSFVLAPPMYESAALFYVKNSAAVQDSTSASVGAGDLAASRDLVQSCLVILQTHRTLDAVIEESGVELTVKQLEKRISAAPVDDTEIFRVTVAAPEAWEALRIADAVARILPGQICAVMEGASVKVVDTPVEAARPASPGYGVYGLSGFLAGLALAACFVVLRELMNTTVYSEEELADGCRCPVLAAVPDMKRRGRHGKRQNADGMCALRERETLWGDSVGFAAAEAYRLLRTKLQFSFAEEELCRVIGISSAMDGEGKSTSAVNLAYHLAQLGKRVLLMDCDMRNSAAEQLLQLKKVPGLSDYLTGQANQREILQLGGTGAERQTFAIVASGCTQPDPAELLSSRAMADLMADLRQDYDWIILDLPAVGEVSDALAAAPMCDGMILVVRQDYGSCDALNAAIRQFDFVGARILGVVFNCADADNARRGVRRRQKYSPEECKGCDGAAVEEPAPDAEGARL